MEAERPQDCNVGIKILCRLDISVVRATPLKLDYFVTDVKTGPGCLQYHGWAKIPDTVIMDQLAVELISHVSRVMNRNVEAGSQQGMVEPTDVAMAVRGDDGREPDGPINVEKPEPQRGIDVDPPHLFQKLRDLPDFFVDSSRRGTEFPNSAKTVKWRSGISTVLPWHSSKASFFSL